MIDEKNQTGSEAGSQPKPVLGLIEVKVLGQEGDEKEVRVNPHQPCEHLLREGLHALYGLPGPDPGQYNLVFHGKVVEPLSQSIEHAGIGDRATVSIQPKSISRGSVEAVPCLR